MICGPVAFWILPFNVNADIFRLFVLLMLPPPIRPQPHAYHLRRVILWDNLRVHFDAENLRRRVLWWFPALPYSPDMAPIESAFSKMMGFLRTHKDSLTEANLRDYILRGISTNTARDIQGWFGHRLQPWFSFKSAMGSPRSLKAALRMRQLSPTARV